MPAPAAINPSASEAPPIRVTVGSSKAGMCSPARLAARPSTVAMISGLRASARPKPVFAWRAIGQTAATL
jgi:hypothetical protein